MYRILIVEDDAVIAAAMERQPVQPGSAAGAEVRPVSAMDRMRRQTQEAVRPR